jgi:hypothetical protein
MVLRERFRLVAARACGSRWVVLVFEGVLVVVLLMLAFRHRQDDVRTAVEGVYAGD